MIDFNNLTPEQQKQRDKEMRKYYKKTYHHNMNYLDCLFLNVIDYLFRKKQMKVKFDYESYDTLDEMKSYLFNIFVINMKQFTNIKKMNELFNEYVCLKIIVNKLKKDKDIINERYKEILLLANKQLTLIRNTPPWTTWIEKKIKKTYI